MRYPDIHIIFKPLLDEFDVIIERNPTSEAVEYRKLVSAYIDLYIKKSSLHEREMISSEDLYILMGKYATCMRLINSEFKSDYRSNIPLSMIFDLINNAIIVRE